MSFSTSDLHISQHDLDKITRTLTNLGATDPIGSAIAEQTQRVRDYTARYVLDERRENRLIRPLVLYQLYIQLPGGAVPPNIDSGYKDAMAELADIRGGKFADILQQNPLPGDVNTRTQGAFGSRRRGGLGGGREHGEFSRGGGGGGAPCPAPAPVVPAGPATAVSLLQTVGPNAGQWFRLVMAYEGGVDVLSTTGPFTGP